MVVNVLRFINFKEKNQSESVSKDFAPLCSHLISLLLSLGYAVFHLPQKSACLDH